MGIDARAKRIELAVSANTAPGFMWWSRLEGVASRGGTTITNIVGKGWKDPPGEVMLVRTANTSDCFRGLVSLLTADDAEGGIPAEVIEEVRVFGLVRDGVLSQHAVLPWEDEARIWQNTNRCGVGSITGMESRAPPGGARRPDSGGCPRCHRRGRERAAEYRGAKRAPLLRAIKETPDVAEWGDRDDL